MRMRSGTWDEKLGPPSTGRRKKKSMLWVLLGFYIVGASSSFNNCPFEDLECLSTDTRTQFE